MPIRELKRDEWRTYFDDFSRDLIKEKRTDYAEIRVLSTEDGAQPETSWVPLSGLTYDHRDDLLEVQVKGLDHLIFHPSQIYVDETSGTLGSLEIIQADGTKQIIELR